MLEALDPLTRIARARRLLPPLQDELQMAIYTAALRQILDLPGAGTGYDPAIAALRDALLQRELLSLARLFDKPRFDRNGRSERVSLPHLLALLDERIVTAWLVEEARDWLPDQPEEADWQAAEAARALLRAQVIWRHLRLGWHSGMAGIEAVRRIRDERLAHRLLDGEDPRAAVRLVDPVRGLAERLLDLCTYGLSGEPLDVQEIRETAASDARALRARLAL